MAEFITREELKRLGARRSLNEQTVRVRQAQARSVAGSVFLSHSTKDADILPGVIEFLEHYGAQVYIDKKDETLPPYTSRETAKVLRDRIRLCRKFILLTTPTSKNSRWMPWELGIADGHRGTQNMAILPTPDVASDQSWAEQEYLGVYDRIVLGKFTGTDEDTMMVLNQEKNSASGLEHWLKR
jgi:hypothetical protein